MNSACILKETYSMHSLKSITIPEPCHQSWQQMAPVTGGRHCASCCKIVTDFTGMSNADIIAMLSANKNQCGRFDPGQLNSLNAALAANEKNAFKKWTVAALLAGLISVTENRAKAQTIHPQYVSAVKARPLAYDTLKYLVITGRVTIPSDDFVPLVTISVEKTKTTALTNNSGFFEIHVPPGTDTLTFTAKGFITKRVRLKPGQASVNVELTGPGAYLSEQRVSLVGGIVAIRRSFAWRVWYHVKRTVRSIF